MFEASLFDVVSLSDKGLSHGISALNQPDEHCHDGQDQQDVNESPEGVRTDHSQQPKNQKQHSDCPKHDLASIDASDRFLSAEAKTSQAVSCQPSCEMSRG